MQRTSINPTRGVRLRKRNLICVGEPITNSFAGDPDVENGEKPVPSHLVASPAADTPSNSNLFGNPLPYPIPVNINPSMHGLAAAANLYEPALTFLDIATGFFTTLPVVNRIRYASSTP